ncbi:MAG: hypothetical protein ACRDNG_07095, partial [Gaiellaceae bacterium]
MWRTRAPELAPNPLGQDDVALALEEGQGSFSERDRLGFAAGASNDVRQIDEDTGLAIEVVRV